MAEPYFFRHSTSLTLAINNSTPVSTTTAIRVGIAYVRLCASQDCWVTIDGNTQAAVGHGTFLPAGYVEVRLVSATDTISAIVDTGAQAATGNLNIVYLTR